MSYRQIRRMGRIGRISHRRSLTGIFLYFVLSLGAVTILIPFLWMISTSLKTREMVGEYPPHWLPENEHAYIAGDHGREEILILMEARDGRTKVRFSDGTTGFVSSQSIVRDRRLEPQWTNYTRVLSPKRGSSDDDFLRYLLNTLVIAGMCVIGQVLTSSMVGWGFARLRFVGNRMLFMVMLATMMIPAQVGMVPSFIIFRWLGWIDTFLPLIIPAWFGSAFFAFLYRQYFMGIPLELDEAARIDGCNPLGVYWNILFPMAKPVTVTTAVFTFLGSWNDFLGPLIYLNSDHKRTLSLALTKFQSAYAFDIPAVMAAATLMMVPVLLIYFFSQRTLVQGMVVSGVKG